jgi:formylglycine-generating enzyme required for sulfatase activity
MPPKLKIVAEEILMCGLKSIPVAGKAFEVIDAVRSRHSMLAHGERLEEIERQMSRMDRRLRDLVEEEIRITLQRLGEPALDGLTLTAEIRNLRSIQQQGWEPTLFEGLLRNSSHWNELKSRPQHYGRVLEAQSMIDPDGIHVLIDADPLRVLELTPFAFAGLLANQSRGIPGADIQATADIWAFPTSADSRKALISSIGLKLVRIEPGSFTMGSNKQQIDQLLRLFPDSEREWFDDEQPQHRVKITRPFFLGTHPVTQGQYKAIMGSNPSLCKGSDDLPVENVSWLD